MLVDKYLRPLKSFDGRALIDAALVDEIFYSIPELLKHHENLLARLQDKLAHCLTSSHVTIGSLFTEAFTSLEIIQTYTAFINNWKNARTAIKVASQSRPAFDKFLKQTSREHKNKLTLDALLIMPVQRIPRYELLIKVSEKCALASCKVCCRCLFG